MKADASKIDRHEYADGQVLAEALALSVAGVLAGGIAARGSAVLAVSGGSTPKQFFRHLSAAPIEWSKVTIILVDERIVPADHDRANAKLVGELLLVENAKNAHFQPYIVTCQTPEECASKSAGAFGSTLDNIDALVLGMGTDGHTASFFPNGDNLSSALSLNCAETVLPMRADGAGEPRLTLSLPVILNAHFLALHIEGEAKANVLEQALQGNDQTSTPIMGVINNAKTPIKVFWAP